ncbi:hypothetical protein HY419_00295, partial [candidate division WWE3 bacterium]|nr:hypothetical protein [candidate division WWE3 bacterium]
VSPFASSDFDTNSTNIVSHHDTFDKVWVYDDDAGTQYEDETTDADDSGTADILHSTSGRMVAAASDAIYFGNSETFDAISWVLSTNGAGGTIVWEYCSAVDATPACTTWSSLSLDNQPAPNFTSNSFIAFVAPSDWQAARVNGEGTSYYYVRARVSVAYTTGPIGTQMASTTIITWGNVAASTNGVYAIWTENATAPGRMRYSTPVNNNTAPSDPSSLGPSTLVDGSFGTDTTPTLTFTLSDPDVSEPVQYQIQIDDTSDFSSAVVDYTSAFQDEGSASFTVGQGAGSGGYTTGSSGQTLSDSSYYWRVRALDDNQSASSYSTANSGSIAFKIDTTGPTAPGTPSTTTPTNDTTPTWTWTASTDTGSGLASSATYTVEWCTSSSFSGCSSNTSTTTTNSFTHSTALADGTWYFRVKSKDTLDNESSYSSNGSVLIDTVAPNDFDLDSPSDGAYTLSERPTFKWKAASTGDASSGLSKYKLDIDNGDSGDFVVDSIPVSRTTDYEKDNYLSG